MSVGHTNQIVICATLGNALQIFDLAKKEASKIIFEEGMNFMV